MHPKSPLLGCGILAFVLWAGGCGTPKAPPLRATFLDVGQGDSCVLETASGKVCVIDTGGKLQSSGDDMGRRVVVPYLRSRGVGQIDVLILTHPDIDHIGGAEAVLRQFPVAHLLLNTAQANTALEPLKKIAQERGTTLHYAQPGQWIDLHGGTELHLLAPSPALKAEKDNNQSIAVRIVQGKTRLLLTGDAEAEEERDMLKRGMPLQANLLKVGHHGSHTSTIPEFLRAVHPQVAILSAGKGNPFGHPHAEIVERLQKERIEIFRTDQQGAITCDSNGENIVCTPYTRFPQ
jgi:competence protein ComEC